jgi:hypothetical protein
MERSSPMSQGLKNPWILEAEDPPVPVGTRGAPDSWSLGGDPQGSCLTDLGDP